MSVFDQFSDPDLCKALLAQLKSESDGFRFMEVCGTHTVSIFQSGLHSVLPKGFDHLTGPGCPVCVTHDAEVAAFIEAASRPDVIICTFGDLMKVPGPQGRSLKTAQAEGATIKVVYSPADAIPIAAENPDKLVLFIGVGFETTTPGIAACVKMAKAQGIENFKILAFHKLVPPALGALLNDPEMIIEAFILPGHVSAVIGLEPYKFVAEQYGIPAVIAGFEPSDLLQALLVLAKMRNEGRAEVVNLYTRVVSDQGNPKACELMYDVFETSDALWRGIGMIPGSGLVFRKEYEDFDGLKALGIELVEQEYIKGCKCGDVLKGKIKPNMCPLFKKACSPANPVGPCMVSNEGSCAAYFKYDIDS